MSGGKSSALWAERSSTAWEAAAGILATSPNGTGHYWMAEPGSTTACLAFQIARSIYPVGMLLSSCRFRGSFFLFLCFSI